MKWTPQHWQDYTLLDSGRGRKLEQFGPIRLIRPEERAVWKPALSSDEWHQAHAEFIPKERGTGGHWEHNHDFDPKWSITYAGMTIGLEVANSVQVGVFPENGAQWDWIDAQVRKADRPLRILNLFGYTGIASLAAAAAGAEVTHVDAAKRAIRMGKENQSLSKLEDRKIRWIVEDAVKFVQREERRGNEYDAIIMDPPAYGVGPQRERWEFYKHFPGLCRLMRDILSDDPAFVVVTAYAINAKPDILHEPLVELLPRRAHKSDVGELILEEKSAGRKIDYSISARWSNPGSGNKK